MKTVGDLISELSRYPAELQVIVPSDDGRALGFDPLVELTYQSGELFGRPLFTRLGNDRPLLLIKIDDTAR